MNTSRDFTDSGTRLCFLNEHASADWPTHSHSHRRSTAPHVVTTDTCKLIACTNKHVTAPSNAEPRAVKDTQHWRRKTHRLFAPHRNRHEQNFSVADFDLLRQREQSKLSPRENIQIKQWCHMKRYRSMQSLAGGLRGWEKRQHSFRAQLCYSSSVATCHLKGY